MRLMNGVPTYESWGGEDFAYYVSDHDQWFLIGRAQWEAVSHGEEWFYAQLSTEDFICGCRDDENGVNGVSCDRVRGPNARYSNLRCDASVQYKALAQAYCPLTCGLDLCKIS